MIVTAAFNMIPGRPDGIEWMEGSRHYEAALKFDGEVYTTLYSMGPGLKDDPTCADLLECVLMDASIVVECPTFGAYLDEFGGPPPERKYVDMERSYRAILANLDALRLALGPRFETIVFEHSDPDEWEIPDTATVLLAT